MPHNTEGVIKTGDERSGIKLMRVQSVLEILNLTKSQRLAGEELAKLKDCCRRYHIGGPSPNPKVSDLNRGHSHEGELTDRVISLGVKFMDKYAKAVEVLRVAGKGVIPIVCKVCFDNKYPEPEDRQRLYRGLNALADHWNL